MQPHPGPTSAAAGLKTLTYAGIGYQILAFLGFTLQLAPHERLY